MILFGKKEIEKTLINNKEINELKIGSMELKPPIEEPKIPTELTVTPDTGVNVKQGQTAELVVNTNANTYNVEVVGEDDIVLVTKKYTDANTIVVIGRNVGNVTLKVSATLSDTKTVEIPVNVEFESETVLILDKIELDMVPNTTQTVGADSNADNIDARSEQEEIASTEVKKHVKI